MNNKRDNIMYISKEKFVFLGVNDVNLLSIMHGMNNIVSSFWTAVPKL
jgi:hypothetical protein